MVIITILIIIVITQPQAWFVTYSSLLQTDMFQGKKPEEDDDDDIKNRKDLSRSVAEPCLS
jgi:hypothetical protein